MDPFTLLENQWDHPMPAPQALRISAANNGEHEAQATGDERKREGSQFLKDDHYYSLSYWSLNDKSFLVRERMFLCASSVVLPT